MTTVSPPPNWYADPTGRHENRFWDGFTWTAHIADGGTAGVDPLVQPVADPADRRDLPVIGPGTAQLRAIAESRRVGATADAPAAPTVPARRRLRAYEVAVVVAVVLVAAVVAYGLWHSWSSSDASGRGDTNGTGIWSGTGYRFVVPPSWVERDVPPDLAATDADGAFTVIDGSPVAALVGPDALTRRQAPNPARLAEVLTAQTAGPAPEGTTASTTVDVLPDGDRQIGRVQIDTTTPEGITLRSLVFVVVGRERSVALMLVGAPDGVDRHERTARAAARSVTGIS